MRCLRCFDHVIHTFVSKSRRKTLYNVVLGRDRHVEELSHAVERPRLDLYAMAKILASRFRLGAGLATALAAGGTVAVCESDKRGPLFDPEALERGAKALKEINASPFAKKVSPDLTAPLKMQNFQLHEGHARIR